ncbi:hypothetical protein Bhyg_16351 [Pseudolycoriella hygida]|uniref:PAXIP1-associated glutamate-rich protein 1 n=1 Tax=Pseudolycoriella hygida TaxID=35572 RepID=A0A9Q0MJQ1_9DIPT|nr:hypothetical protein Bhyg_16351 [Pseudolycoriella hygida]
MESSNWSIPCIADDEELEPSAEDLEAMYQKLENGSLLDLQWKCPGRRRAPTPPTAVEAEVPAAPEKEIVSKNKEFDFMEEVAKPAMRVRPNTTPKTSAKKKTANFAGVLDAMKKHRLSSSNPSNTSKESGS